MDFIKEKRREVKERSSLFFHLKEAEPVFSNVYEALESIPMHEFRQPM
jgi:hypothetical protein